MASIEIKYVAFASLFSMNGADGGQWGHVPLNFEVGWTQIMQYNMPPFITEHIVLLNCINQIVVMKKNILKQIIGIVSVECSLSSSAYTDYGAI